MDAAQAEPPAGPKPPEAEPAKAKKGSSSKGPWPRLCDGGAPPQGDEQKGLPPCFNPIHYVSLPPSLPAISRQLTHSHPHPHPRQTDAKPKKEKSKDKDKAESKSKSKSKDKASSSSSSQSRRSGSMADEAAATTATGGEKPPAEAAAAAPVPALGPPPTPTEARGMARTLSFHGGLAVTEALHAELAMGVLHLVENEEDASGGLTLQAPGVIAREERGNPRSPLGGGSGKLPRPTVMGDTCHATLSLYPVLTGAGSNQQRCGFLEAVVDAGPTRRLEKAGALNWHAECPYLVALKVR